MKAIRFSLALCIFLNLTANAQQAINLTDGPVTFKHGTHPGFVLTIPEVSLQGAKDAWIASLEKNTQSKVQVEDAELSIFGSLIRDIYDVPINVYSKLSEADNAVQLAVTFEPKKNEFIDAAMGSAYDEARKYLLAFARDQYTGLVKAQLQEEEKKLKELEKAMKKMESGTKKYENTIEKNNKTIESLSSAITTDQTSLTSLNTEFALQKSQYETMADGAAKDEKKKFIATMEKKIKGLNKNIRKNEKKIESLKNDAEKARKKSEECIRGQENAKEIIQKQKNEVDSLNQKLKSIQSM